MDHHEKSKAHTYRIDWIMIIILLYIFYTYKLYTILFIYYLSIVCFYLLVCLRSSLCGTWQGLPSVQSVQEYKMPVVSVYQV